MSDSTSTLTTDTDSVTVDRPVDHYLKQELYQLVARNGDIFEFLQAGSLDGVWYWDLERPEHEWMSPRFWEALGFDPAERQHLASEWQDLIDPSDLALALENFRRHCDDPDHPYDQIVRYRHRDGSTVWIRCRGLVIRDENGQPRRMLGAHTNVTELMAARERLQQAHDELENRVQERTDETNRRAAELAQANRDLRQFAQVAAHDLQQPLRTIVSYLQLIECHVGERLDGIEREWVEHAAAAGRRMKQLIDDLLHYSEVGARERERERVRLEAVLRDVLHGLTDPISGADASVTFGALPVLVTDRSLVRLLLFNLIDNAIKFRGDAPPEIRIEARIEPGAVCITVRDNGIGIEPRHFDRIFRMFQRLHPVGRYAGTGAGLAMCKRIVELLDGELSVESDAGEGACFNVRLPQPDATTESSSSR